jgi:hypothetical protein
MPIQERTSAFEEAFAPAFRGGRVTILSEAPPRPSR